MSLAGPSRLAAAAGHVRHARRRLECVRAVSAPRSTGATRRQLSTSPILRSTGSRPRPRPFSTATGAAAEAPAAALPPAFAPLAATLSASQPCFGIHGDNVEIIPTPTAFHERLLEMIGRARKRILISSLYIGIEEESLVDAISTALASNPGLRATFVLDYNRSTRPTRGPGPASTAHMLLPLIERFGDRVDVWLYRTPKLRGLAERIVPPRFNEGWGTWHAKYYAVDDDVVLTGANLASSYFTNRQDRYVHIASHPSLLSYLSSLTRLISDYSYKLVPRVRGTLAAGDVLLDTIAGKKESSTSPSPSSSPSSPGLTGPALLWRERSLPPRGWAPHACATLSAFQQAWRASNGVRARDAHAAGADTWFWPVVQAGVLGIREEERALGAVWDAVRASDTGVPSETSVPVEVDLTSGYFGLYKAYKRAVVESPAPVRVIAASPQANGFFKSKGFSGLIPEGYTLLEKQFYADVEKHGRVWDPATGEGVRLQEWERKGWTYHAKGMWVSPLSSPPILTFLGSSNLSTRSLDLDTELSLVVATRSPSLRAALADELAQLRAHAHDVGPKTWADPERRVSVLARVLVALGVEGML